MKFRCERDTLADAVATAQRAVASRTGALPVLSGLRVAARPPTASSSSAPTSSSRSGSRVPAEVDERRGARSSRPGCSREIVRKLDGGHRDRGARPTTRRQHRGRPVRARRCARSPAAEFPRLPEPARAGRAGRGGRVRRGAAPGGAGGVEGRRPPDPHRCAARPRRPDGLRLVATDSYRLAVRDLQGVSMLAEGQKVLVAAKGLGEVQRLARADGEIEVVLGEREVVFRVGATEVTTRLIEGEFPNYQQLIPSGYPNRLTVSREALQAAVNRVRLVGQGRDTAPIRLGMSVGRARALGDRPGRRRGARVGRGEVRGHRPHRRVQLAVPARRHRRDRRPTRSCIESIDPLKPAVLKATDQRRLPLPAHAGAHRLSASVERAPGRELWLTDFRCYEEVDDRARPRGHGHHAATNGQGKTSLLEAVGWAASAQVVPRRSRRARWCAPARRRRSCGPRWTTTGARSCSRPRSGRAAATACCSTSNPLQRTRDLLGLVRVTVFAPDDLQLVKGGPAGRRDYLDDLLVALAPRYEAARTRLRAGAPAAQRAAAAAGVRDDGRSRTLDVFDDQLGRGRRRARPGPAAAARAARPRGRRTPTRSSPASRTPVDRDVRGRVGRGARRPTRRRSRATLLDAALRERRSGRDRPRGHPGRSAPRRVAAAASTGSTSRTTRRRASSARSRSRCASPATALCAELTGTRAGAAPRRRVQRARRRTRRRAGRAPAAGADVGDDRAARCRAGIAAERRAARRTPAASRTTRERPLT